MHINTPLIRYQCSDLNVFLKLDNLQPSGSFKIRGLYNTIKTQTLKNPDLTTVISSSGGNAGLAATLAANAMNLNVIVFVPSTTPISSRDTLVNFGAQVRVSGDVWDDTHREAEAYTKSLGEKAFLVHPFEGTCLFLTRSGVDTWQGHSTLVDEIVETLGRLPDVLVCSVGGGGLLNGIITGLIKHKAKTVVVGVETRGADSFHQALLAGKPVQIPSITSIAKSLGARQVSQGCLDLSREYGREKVRSLVLDDELAVDAVDRFLKEHRMLVEPACGVSLAAVFDAAHLKSVVPELTNESVVVVEVCGGFQVGSWKRAD